MDEILRKNGWRLYSSCSCGGTMEKKFTNRLFEGIVIHVRPLQKKWSVKKRNRDIAQGNPANFNAKMVEYGYIKENASGAPNTEAQSKA
jgi:hypothetical protein